MRSKFAWCDPDILNEHYAHITSKPFYPEVFDYMTSAPAFQVDFCFVLGLFLCDSCFYAYVAQLTLPEPYHQIWLLL